MSINHFFKPTALKRTAFFLLFDTLISIATILLAYLLRFNFDIPLTFVEGMFKMMLILIPLKIAIFFVSKIYFVAWQRGKV